MSQKITTAMISRRKALSLLGLGAALGFTLSSALEPLEAEAQETTGRAAAPAQATGTHGMNRRAFKAAMAAIERRHGRHERRHERRTGEKRRPATPAGQHLTAIAVRLLTTTGLRGLMG